MHVPYYSPEASRDQLAAESVIPQEIYKEIVGLLEDPRLLDEVRTGNITVAMIRPELTESSNLTGSDTEIADQVEEHIALAMIAKFAVVFDNDAVDEFYAGQPMDLQLTKQPMRKTDFPTRWHEFRAAMTNGPTTILLLHTTQGNAIDEWRQQVGHWNIETNRDPATIRGRFGIDNYNNLVHGSDSSASVERELDIIKRCIERQLASAGN